MVPCTVMSESPRSNAAETTIPISPELRDRLRVEKAEDGDSYDAYLRENLSLED